MSNNIENYQNKRILFFGDSITALGTEERGWIRYFNVIVKPSHFENVVVCIQMFRGLKKLPNTMPVH